MTDTTTIEDRHVVEHKQGGIGELAATAICGNDITSSCLYVSALAILYAGVWAPVVLLAVSFVLFLFRSIYAEVVGALPLNGGAYNALLNTTSKFRASVAACLTILSYVATAVISANEAMHYAQGLWKGLPVMESTILLLAGFMGLTILGISDSARVAIGIFLIHLSTLTLLSIVGIVGFLRHGFAIIEANLATPVTVSVPHALFFGFSAALLGISGFESSANFVEEQAEGIFPKTLRNMWAAVTVFNPGIALVALALVPLAEISQHQEALLAHMGELSGGPWLASLVSLDAVLVLSGAVLTSFVGVNGLMRRMTLDRCLPQLLLKPNSRGTTHRILISFFILTVSILLITGGDLKALAGVYTISFLSVMVLFGLGNILLKVRRSGLPRSTRAPWYAVGLAIAAVVAGLAGNIIMNPEYFRVFLEYFLPTLLVVSIMLGRISLLNAALFVVHEALAYVDRKMGGLSAVISQKIDEISAQKIVFFSKGDDIAKLNHAMLYVRNNEHTNRIKVVTVLDEGQEPPAKLAQDLEFLDKAYPEIVIEPVVLRGAFGPHLIDQLSQEWKIPKNFMFIGSPNGHLMYGLAELGGVRVII